MSPCWLRGDLSSRRSSTAQNVRWPQGSRLTRPGRATLLRREDQRLRIFENDYDASSPKLADEAQDASIDGGNRGGHAHDIGVGVVNSLFAGLTILILSIFMFANGRSCVIADRAATTRQCRAPGAAVSGSPPGAPTTSAARWRWRPSPDHHFIVTEILGILFAGPLAVLVASPTSSSRSSARRCGSARRHRPLLRRRLPIDRSSGSYGRSSTISCRNRSSRPRSSAARRRSTRFVFPRLGALRLRPCSSSEERCWPTAGCPSLQIACSVVAFPPELAGERR